MRPSLGWALAVATAAVVAGLLGAASQAALLDLQARSRLTADDIRSLMEAYPYQDRVVAQFRVSRAGRT